MHFERLIQELGIDLTEKMKQQFAMYFAMLVEENEHINLTSITDYDGVYLKHFYDSLTLTKSFNFQQNVEICDIGAGAGFPSIPLKIVFPEIKVTIIDSLGKRCDFLKRLVKKLELDNVEIIWGRAEEIKGQYDIVTARAVARLNILVELCLPLVKKGGYFLSMKGSADEEVREASKGIDILGGRIKQYIKFNLPVENSERGIIVVEKVADTPKQYPRGFGAIKRNPL